MKKLKQDLEDEAKKKSEKEYRLSIREIMNFSFNCINVEDKIYIATNNKTDEQFMVERRGVCEYKKCKNACCKFIHESLGPKDSGYDFHINFFDKGKRSGITMAKTCCQLGDKGLCNVWDKKKFPKPCKDFPHPNDQHYWEVSDVCSFYFVKLYKLKAMGKR